MTDRHDHSNITLIAVCFGLFMIQLDLTVVNGALKSIQDNLHAGVTALQWVVDAYAILFSSLMLTTGVVAAILGSAAALLLGAFISWQFIEFHTI